MGDTQDLGLILDSGIPIVAIESPDERRVLDLLLGLAMKRGLPLKEWTLTRGLRPGGLPYRKSIGGSNLRSMRSAPVV